MPTWIECLASLIASASFSNSRFWSGELGWTAANLWNTAWSKTRVPGLPNTSLMALMNRSGLSAIVSSVMSYLARRTYSMTSAGEEPSALKASLMASKVETSTVDLFVAAQGEQVNYYQ